MNDTALLHGGLPKITVHAYGVELHPNLPPLPAGIFEVLQARVADEAEAAGRRKGLVLTPDERLALANLALLLFHARGGLCGKLYARDETVVGFLRHVLDHAVERGGADPAAMQAAMLSADEHFPSLRREPQPEPRLDRPPLPDAVYAAVRAHVLAAIRDIAARKNVPPAVAKFDEEADAMVRFLHVLGLAENLLRSDPEALERMEHAIDNAMDHNMAMAAVQASALSLAAPEDRPDPDALLLWTYEAAHRLRRRCPPGSFYRWPDSGGGILAAFAPLGITTYDLKGART